MSDPGTTEAKTDSLYAIIQQIRPLTLDQFESHVAQAKALVINTVGVKPDKKKFDQERKALFTGVERLMLLLLVVLFLFSIIHVFYWTRLQAINSYTALDSSNGEFGISVSESLYVILHQISVLGVTEIGMIALSIYHIYRARFFPTPELKKDRWLPIRFLQKYFFLILAALCGVVILGANLSSGFDTLVSVLVPLLTISLSEMFARIFAERYTETLEIEKRYQEAINIFQKYNADPASHPDYSRFLSTYIQDWYRKNRSYVHIPWNPQILNYLSAREKYLHSNAVNDTAILEQFMAEGGGMGSPFLGQTNPSNLSSVNGAHKLSEQPSPESLPPSSQV